MSDDFIIGVDLGGTRLRAARLDRQLNILERHETLTKAYEGKEATLKRVKGLIRETLPEDLTSVLGIGISVPGPTNSAAGILVAPPNLPGWHNVPIVQILQDEFDLPVFVGNDANVAALAEAALGAAKGYRDAIYLTISTGVGSGIITGGTLVLGNEGIGGEAGHMIITVEAGRVSTLEKEAAGPALARQARMWIDKGEKTLLLEMCDGDLSSIDARMIGDAAKAGDEMALKIVKRAGKMVGLGIVTLLHIFNPKVVVIGGGVSYIGDLLFDEMRVTVKEHVIDASYWAHTEIVHSQISEDVSILGSATLVLTQGGQIDVTQVIQKLGL